MAQSLSKKDKAVIDANPEASPLELIELGLSKQGYDILTTPSVEAKEPKEKEPTAQAIVEPIISGTNTAKSSKKATATVINTETGRVVKMGLKFALMVVENDPKFKLLN